MCTSVSSKYDKLKTFIFKIIISSDFKIRIQKFEAWKNILFTLILALIFCGIFAFSMHRDRGRYRNVVFLLLSAVSLVDLILSFFRRTAGTIELVLAVVLFLFLLVFPFLLIVNGVVMTRREGKSLANLLSLVLGLVLLTGEIAMFLWGVGLFFQPGAVQGRLDKVIAGISPALLLLMVTTLYCELPEKSTLNSF